MAIKVNVNGVAKDITDIKINVNGVAKQVSQVYQNIGGGTKLVWENWKPYATAGGSLPSSPWTFGGNTSYYSYTDGYIYLKSTNSSGGNTTSYYQIQNAFDDYNGVQIEGIAKATSGINNGFHFRKNGSVYLDIMFDEHNSKSIYLRDGANSNKVLATISTDVTEEHKVKLIVNGTTVSFYVDDECLLENYTAGTWTKTGNTVYFGCENAWDNCNFYVKEITVKVK